MYSKKLTCWIRLKSKGCILGFIGKNKTKHSFMVHCKIKNSLSDSCFAFRNSWNIHMSFVTQYSLYELKIVVIIWPVTWLKPSSAQYLDTIKCCFKYKYSFFFQSWLYPLAADFFMSTRGSCHVKNCVCLKSQEKQETSLAASPSLDNVCTASSSSV